jgi:lysophospholipase L1-like esterase
MKKPLKILLCTGLVIVVWFVVLLGFALNMNKVFASLYELKYDRIGYPQGEVLLIGSSSIQNWRTSEADLGPLHSANVGLSGSVIADWQPLVDRLVTPFHPKAVVIYVGANDIHSKNPKTPEAVIGELGQLFERIHAALPDTRIYYVTVFAAGAFPDAREAEQQLTAGVNELAQILDYLTVIDCAAALLGEDGEVRDELFLGDHVHLNEAGYVIWSQTVREALMRDFGDGIDSGKEIDDDGAAGGGDTGDDGDSNGGGDGAKPETEG